MKAHLVHEYGEAAQFIETEVAAPKIKPNHVIIDVKATSLNPIDYKIRTLDMGINPDLPATLHMDVAGIITEIGEGVTQFKVGDEVYGCAGGLQGAAGKIDGALADYMLADTNLIALKPKSLNFLEAAALPLVSITAWEALIDRAKIKPGDHVLIHAGTGGVGHLAIQLAKNSGARVATTVSTQAKAEIAKKLGADEIIFYRDKSVADYVKSLTNDNGFDVVFDTVGADNLDKSFEAVRINGTVVGIMVTQDAHDLKPLFLKGLNVHMVFMLLPMLTGKGREHHGYILNEIAKLVDTGKITPLIHEHSFKFNQSNEAHALFATNKHLGKIILTNEV